MSRPLVLATSLALLPFVAFSSAQASAAAPGSASVGTTTTAAAPPVFVQKKSKKNKKRKKRKQTRVKIRLAPATVTRGEPSGLMVHVKPERRRTVKVQMRTGSRWRTVETLKTGKRDGEAYLPLATSANRIFRAKVQRNKRFKPKRSNQVKLRALPRSACERTGSVDPNARATARCTIAKIDRWRASRVMGIGQQINAASDQFAAPLDALKGRSVAVVGFDLEELDQSEYDFPFEERIIRELLRRANEDGSILVAAWHAPNPDAMVANPDRPNLTPYMDIGQRDPNLVSDLFDPDSERAQAFWDNYDTKLELFRRLQIGDIDGDGTSDTQGASVVFRPFHEVNGDWFWWARPGAYEYKMLYREIQNRTWAAGVHNIVWAYSYNYKTFSDEPRQYIPWRADMGGFNSYDPEPGAYTDQPKVARFHAPDRLDLNGYRDVAKSLKRMAITETGAHGSHDGNWQPVTVENRVRAAGLNPAWAMFWYNDFSPGARFTGLKAIASMRGGVKWLDSCPNALCYVGR